jgi:hypothetical protein
MCWSCMENKILANDIENFEKEFDRLAKTEEPVKKDLGDLLRKKYDDSKQFYDKNNLK